MFFDIHMCFYLTSTIYTFLYMFKLLRLLKMLLLFHIVFMPFDLYSMNNIQLGMKLNQLNIFQLYSDYTFQQDTLFLLYLFLHHNSYLQGKYIHAEL